MKKKFLTYKKDKIERKLHEEISLNDADLDNFLKLLSIDINAKKYTEQFIAIIGRLREEFSCDEFEAEFYYYNNALNEIRKLAIQEKIGDRRISKNEFLININKKHIFFNKWFLELKGQKKYHTEIKNKYFRALNKAPFERFFLIDLPENYTIVELKDLVFLISQRFSNIKRREPSPYCPYIHFNKISSNDILELKKQLYREEFNFIDGFPFKGSEFSLRLITKTANHNNQIKIKLLESEDHITSTISNVTKTKEIYQFHFTDSPYFSTSESNNKNIVIQITDLANIREII